MSAAVVYDLIRLTRPVVLSSSRVVAATWREVGITAAMRAVLETLRERGPTAVPEIARTLDISRQAAQRTINDLARAGHVVALPNPAHRRSPLFTLTDRSRGLFDDLHAREQDSLAEMTADLPPEDIVTAHRVLRILDERIRRRAHELGGDIHATD